MPAKPTTASATVSPRDAGFAARVIAWQRRCGRHDLPWQAQPAEPYRVWLSEIMLQQTQVAAVIPYYLRFLQRFPDLDALAAAQLDEVMAAWSGLGYYARARNLHACARRLAAAGGRFPTAATVIAELPGVGRSTANAIAAFCYGERVAILDGNVKRLLCRHFAIEGYRGSAAVERELWQLAESLLPQRDVAVYLQGQMDLGAAVCTRSRPRCGECPVAATCLARAQDSVGRLPAPRPRAELPRRRSEVLVLRQRDRVLLELRPPSGIWGGLLALPQLAAATDPRQAALRLGCSATGAFRELPILRHDFTHFRLELAPLLAEVEAVPTAAEPGLRWLALGDIEDAALPTPVRTILRRLAAAASENAAVAAPRQDLEPSLDA